MSSTVLMPTVHTAPDTDPDDDTRQDGIHGPVPRERQAPHIQRLRDLYDRKPGVPFYRKEFGFYCLEAWRRQGLPADADLAREFGYDPPAKYHLGQLGWCEAAFLPAFEVKVLEDRGAHEVEQDHAGRKVLYFKGRRSGFMPEYIDHPVKDWRSWEELVKWRLNPTSSARYTDLETRMPKAQAAAREGQLISANIIGGYMYLRSLIGPAELLYAFVDQPELIHDCMRTWLQLADTVTAVHQRYVSIDEVFFGEDICYNKGSLISPRMIQEFLFPYYQQLIANIRARQLDRHRPLFVHLDTDGRAEPVIDLYRRAIGMNVMSPFEVASGCDVVAIGERHPDLVLCGGIDKRILAEGPDVIDRHLDAILPAMRARGGYTPHCDHGVPEEVSLGNYRHYRRRCLEYGG